MLLNKRLGKEKKVSKEGRRKKGKQERKERKVMMDGRKGR